MSWPDANLVTNKGAKAALRKSLSNVSAPDPGSPKSLDRRGTTANIVTSEGDSPGAGKRFSEFGRLGSAKDVRRMFSRSSVSSSSTDAGTDTGSKESMSRTSSWKKAKTTALDAARAVKDPAEKCLAKTANAALRLWKKGSQQFEENAADKFRATVYRRMIFSIAKEHLADKHPFLEIEEDPHHNIKQVIQAVAVGTRHVLMICKVCDTSMALVEELRVKKKMAELSRNLCAGDDWKDFVKNLANVKEEINKAIDRHQDLVDLSAAQNQISTIMHLVEVQEKAGGRCQMHLRTLVEEKSKMQLGHTCNVELAWEALLHAKEEIEETKTCAADLELAVSMLGRGGALDYTDAESAETKQQDAEILSRVPENNLAEIMAGFNDHGLDSEEAVNMASTALADLGGDEHEIKKGLDAMRRAAWRVGVSKTMARVTESSKDVLEELEDLVAETVPLMREKADRDAAELQIRKGSEGNKRTYGNVREIFKLKRTNLQLPSDELMERATKKADYGLNWLDSVRKKIATVNAAGGKQARMSALYIHSDTLRDGLKDHVITNSMSLGDMLDATDGDEPTEDSELQRVKEERGEGDDQEREEETEETEGTESMPGQEGAENESVAGFGLCSASLAENNWRKLEDVAGEASPVSRELVEIEEAEDGLAEDQDVRREGPPLFDAQAEAAKVAARARRTKVQLALEDFILAVVERWNSLEEAKKFLAPTSDVDSPRMISVEELENPCMIPLVELSEELQETSFAKSISCANLCILFQSLGAACSLTNLRVTTEDLLRVFDYESFYDPESESAKQAEAVLHALLVRDALLESQTSEEQLISQVQIAFLELIRTMGLVSEEQEEAKDAFATALRECYLALHAPDGSTFASALISPRGLRVFLDIMVTADVPPEFRIVAGIAISDAIVLKGGSAYKTKGRQQEHSELAKTAGNLQSPEELNKLLSNELWKPLLDVIDPDKLEPPQRLEPELVEIALSLFRQANVPKLVIGPRAVLLASDVHEGLKRLHASPVNASQLLSSLQVFEALEKAHERRESKHGNGNGDAAEVHALAAALGGCRILREQLALLHGTPGGKESKFTLRGDRMLRLWRVARQKLFQKHVIPIFPEECRKFNVLKQALLKAKASGFSNEVPPKTSKAPPVQASKKSKKTPEKPRKTLDMGPIFEVGSPEWKLLVRMANREDQELAQKSVYDWRMPEQMPLAQALRASADYMARGGVGKFGRREPHLRIPPKLQVADCASQPNSKHDRGLRVKSPRSARAVPLPLPLEYNARPQTGDSFQPQTGTSSRPQTRDSLRPLSARKPDSRPQTAGSRCSEMPWVVEESTDHSPYRPNTSTTASPRHGTQGNSPWWKKVMFQQSPQSPRKLLLPLTALDR